MDRNAPRLRYSARKIKQITIRVTEQDFEDFGRACEDEQESKQAVLYALLREWLSSKYDDQE